MRRSLIVAGVAATVMAMVLPGGSASGAGRSALPAGFRAQSLSWVSPQHGWIIGSAPCGQSTCTTVIGTTNGGQTWNAVGTLDAPVTLEQPQGVSEIRFADDLHGWAFEPSLWATDDGGATWQRQRPPGAGHLVLALAANSDAVYAVVSPCRLNHFCGLRATLWRSIPGQEPWRQVPVTLPSFTAFDYAVLAMHGAVAYLAIPSCVVCPPKPDVFDVTVDGRHWAPRPDPCQAVQREVLTGVAPVSDTKVALLCFEQTAPGKGEKRVLRSNDTGKTTRPAGTTPVEGVVSQLAAAPDGTLFVSSFSIESWIYRNAGGQTWTTPVEYNDAGQGWNDIVFTTNQVGFIVHAPVYCCGDHGTGELWETDDGGLTWGPV